MNFKALVKLVFLFPGLVFAGGCTGSKVVGSIPCGADEIEVWSVKNKRNATNGQTWSQAISAGADRTEIVSFWYPGYLPDSFRRKTSGSAPPPTTHQENYPYGNAYQFYMGDFPKAKRDRLTQCLIAKDKSLRELLLKTEAMKRFPPQGAFDDKLVFWETKEKDLDLIFSLTEDGNEFLKMSQSSSIYYHNKASKKFAKVGSLSWNKEGKIRAIEINLTPSTKIAPSQIKAENINSTEEI